MDHSFCLFWGFLACFYCSLFKNKCFLSGRSEYVVTYFVLLGRIITIARQKTKYIWLAENFIHYTCIFTYSEWFQSLIINNWQNERRQREEET